MREELKKPLLEVVKILGITLVIYVMLSWLLPLVIPFLIALLLAKLFHPIVEKLHSKIKIKKGILSSLILFLFLLVAGAIVWFIGKNLFAQIKNIAENLPDYQGKVTGIWNDCCTRIEGWTGIQADTLNERFMSIATQIWDNMRENLLPNLMSSSFSWLRNVLVFSGICIIIGISTLMILRDYDNIKASMGKRELGRATLRIANRVYRAGGGYIKAQGIIMIIISVVCVVGLFLSGNPYALVAGMGIGFCDAFPILGTGTIFIPWAILELFQGKYMVAAVYAIIYTLCSIVRELLEPKLVGDRLGIPPLVIIISIYVGIRIYGLWGFLLGPLSFILIREIWMEIKEN